MVKTLLHAQSPNLCTSVANTTIYPFTGAGAGLWYNSVTSTEAEAQILHRSPGKFTNLAINLSANSVNATTVFTIRKNAAAGNLTISVPTTQTGNFEDAIHSDVIAAGDKITLELKPGAGSTGTCLLQSNGVSFEADTDTVTRMVITDQQNKSTASTTWYDNLGGFTLTAGQNVEASVKCRQRKAGTFKNLCVNVGANARTTATTVTGRLNGANGALTLSIGGGVTGFLEDTTHSDAVVAGNDYCYSTVTGTGAEIMRINSYAIDFVSTAGNGQLVYGTRGGEITSDATTAYFPIGGALGNLGTEVLTRVSSIMYTYSELTCLVSLNDVTTASTLVLRQNSVDSALSVSITGSTTGVFSNSVNTVTAADTDQLSVKAVVPSVSGVHSVTFRNYSLWTLLNSPTQTVFVEWEES